MRRIGIFCIIVTNIFVLLACSTEPEYWVEKRKTIWTDNFETDSTELHFLMKKHDGQAVVVDSFFVFDYNPPHGIEFFFYEDSFYQCSEWLATYGAVGVHFQGKTINAEGNIVSHPLFKIEARSSFDYVHDGRWLKVRFDEGIEYTVDMKLHQIIDTVSFKSEI